MGLPSDDVVALIELRQQDVVEVDRPYAIVDLFQANPVPLERVGDEQEPMLEAERPRARHPFDEEMPGVFLLTFPPNIGPARIGGSRPVTLVPFVDRS